MAGAIDADAPCRHSLQQCALGARTGAVDLVRQQHLGEQRTLLEMKGCIRLMEDIDESVAAGEGVKACAYKSAISIVLLKY